MSFQTDVAKKAKRQATSAAEAAIIASYGRLKGSIELDMVLDEKLAAYPTQRAELRRYIQRLIPHLRDH